MPELEEIRQLLVELEGLSPSGFAIAFHVRFTTADVLFQTYPKDWIDIYSEKGFVMVDPIVKFGFTQTGHARWSDLKAMDEADIFTMSQAYNMNYGVAIATDSLDSRSVAGFARGDREYTDEEIELLTDYVERLHVLTAFKDGMPHDLREELQRMSVKMTHPPARKA